MWMLDLRDMTWTYVDPIDWHNAEWVYYPAIIQPDADKDKEP
jgi:hypothetical protein